MDLWTEASADVEGERHALRLANAKVAVAGLWPFLALAQSENEFDHRLALADDHIANAVPVDLLHEVTAALRADFRRIAKWPEDVSVIEGEGNADHDQYLKRYHENQGKDPNNPYRLKAVDPKDSDDHGESRASNREASRFYHAGLGRWVSYGEPPSREDIEAEDYSHQRMQTNRPMEEDDDPEEDAYWRSLGEAGPSGYHARLKHRKASDEQEDDSSEGKRKPLDFTYYHAGLKRWVAVEQPEGGGNPYYFTGGPEAGPNTGQTNQFPPHPTGADPMDPINEQYPAQPQPWTVPPGGEWKEEPMQFNPPNSNRTTSTRHVAADPGDQDTCLNCGSAVKAVKVSWGNGVDWTHTGNHGAEADDDHSPFPRRYRSAALKTAEEGVEGRPGPNPHYFSGGSEGAAGDPQSGFVPDMAQGVDPDDRVNELYGQTPISGGFADDGSRVAYRTAAGPENPAPNSDTLMGTEFDSPQERERWRKARSGEQQPSRASTTMEASRHGFYDPTDRSVHMAAQDAGGSTNGGMFGGGQLQAAPGGGGGGGGGFSMGDMFGGGNPFGGFGLGGGTPQTTPPRQMPGAGGGLEAADDQGSSDKAAKEQSMQQMQNAAGPTNVRASLYPRVAGDENSRGLGTEFDPTGLGDEYRDRTVEGPLQTRPRQPADHRNVNTPQQPGGAIPTVSSPGPESEGDERREASLAASSIVRELVAW